MLILLYAAFNLYAFYQLRSSVLGVVFIFWAQAMVEGIFQMKGSHALHMLTIPLPVLFSPLLQLKGLLLLLSLQPLLHIRDFFQAPLLDALSLLVVVAVLCTGIWLIFYRKNEKLRELTDSFDKLAREAREIADNASVLNEDLILSRYMTDREEVVRDLRGLLGILERAITADRVMFFLQEEEGLVGFASTDDGEIETTGRGLIYSVFTKKQPLLFCPDKNKKTEYGYLGRGQVNSFIAIPVNDGSITIGVLSADSSRYKAFQRNDMDVMLIVAEEIVRILGRHRVITQFRLAHQGLRILHDESAGLMELLDLEGICQRIISATERLSGAEACLMLKKQRGFRLYASKGLQIKSDRVVSLKGTVLEMVLSNREPLHLSDISSFSRSLKGIVEGEYRSLLVLPVTKEERLKGMLLVLSKKRGGFSSLQVDLLKVLINQAFESIENALLHEEIKLLAYTDGLTGLLNHRRFQESLERELKRAERYREKLSLILTDIDYFKKVNDSFGHPVGDQVLKSVAGMLKSTVREIDIPARYGGEEFALILLNADLTVARKTAERIRKKAMELRFSADGREFGITLSLGIATYPDDAREREHLINRADQALYFAKESGRNRTVLFRDIRTERP